MKQKYLILFSLSGLILCSDQLTKLYVHTLYEPRAVLDAQTFFSLSHTRNLGFAFGLLQKAPEAIHQIFFIGLPIFALILIVLIFIKLQDNQILTSTALTTILAGATGNLIDRVQHGYVIDFINLRFFDISIPAFNIADLSIIVGVAMMFIKAFDHGKTKT